METQFNSLFNDDLTFDPENSEYYHVGKKDDTLLTHTILLTFDKQSLKENIELSDRNFSDTNNYRLGPRSCSTRHASSNKFCDYPGMPEVYEKNKDEHQSYFMPNSSIGDRNIYLNNIDIENRLLNRDFQDNKCDTRKYNKDICDMNDKKCLLNREKKIFEKNVIDYLQEQNNKNNKPKCGFNSNKDFVINEPTKRRDIMNWD